MPDQLHPARAVFLSYASQDAEAVGRICEALRAVGVDVWFDQNALRGGDAWDAQIKKQIHDCALFIPVISAHTNARSEGYFRGEWNLATRRLLNMAHDAAFLVPVVIDETREADARVPEEFLRAHWTWLPGGETPPEFTQWVSQLLVGDSDPVRSPQSGETIPNRRIAAIVSAEVVEYSRLMGIDEESTIAARKLCGSFFHRLVTECGGHEFASVGDSLMAEFPSAVSAVRCAQAVQQRMEKDNAPLASGRRMQLRIGVNLGDIIVERGCAYGDAVDVAAALKSFATPGGVLISAAVYDQVRNKIAARFITAGTRHVNSLAEPVKAFEVLPAELPGAAGQLLAHFRRMMPRPVRLAALGIAALAAILFTFNWYVRERQAREASTPPDESSLAATELPSRSIAVLAFEDRGGSAGTDVLAEGIPETVLHQLSLMQGLTVIARGSSFAFKGHNEDMRVIGRKLNVRYLLEGSVQTAGDRLRVTSSLIDAQTGASVWSRQFNPALQNVFAVQDEIALEVARALQLTLATANDPTIGIHGGTTENYDAYFEFLRGRALLASVRVADLPAAVNALATAIRHDPKFASAYVLLARAKIALAEQNPADDLQKSFPRAIETAMGLLNEAISLNPQSGEAYVERGYLKLYFDVAAADTDLRHGLELAPNYARGYEGLAAVLFQSVARRREALEMVEKARRLDPLELRLDVIKATYLLWGPGDVEQAAQVAEAVLERDPLYVPALVRLADVRWSFEGKHAESIALAEQAVALDPGNETAWRHLALSYLSVDEPAAAKAALGHVADDPALMRLMLNLYQGDWREAGKAAYALIATGPSYRQIEPHIALAIRKYARLTGDYARAVAALEKWASVTWEGDEPVLEEQLGMGVGVAALAEMLMASGQNDRARALLQELLADAEVQINRYGRGEVWLNDGRAIAFALLGRPDDAIEMLQRQARFGFLYSNWRISLENEPAYESLRGRKDFQALLTDVRANEARERKLYLRMRAEGQVPKRS